MQGPVALFLFAAFVISAKEHPQVENFLVTPERVLVKFTTQLDPSSQASNTENRNITAKFMPGDGAANIGKVHQEADEISIPLTPTIPSNAKAIRLCFVQLRFVDHKVEKNLCREGKIETDEQIEAESENAFSILKGKVSQESSDRVKANIIVGTAILDQGTARDAFGRLLAGRYLLIQVTVANKDREYEFMLHNIVVKVPSEHISQSSIELSLLRGGAEHGQLTTPRNTGDRAAKGSGAIAAGMIGVIAHLGHSYAPALALFNGPMITAYEAIFPDFTVNQLNRLNDRAYAANRVIPPKQASVMVAFVPLERVFNLHDQRIYRKNPHEALGKLYDGCIPGAGDVCPVTEVEGNFIQNVDDIGPFITDLAFSDDLKRFESDDADARGYAIGQFLSGSTIALGPGYPNGAKVVLSGNQTESTLAFTVHSRLPLAPKTKLTFVVSKAGKTVTLPRTIDYYPSPPTLATLHTKTSGSNVIKADGSYFLFGGTTIKVTACGASAPDARVTDSKHLEFTLPQTYSTTCKFAVQTDGGESAPVGVSP